jgi:hypothetical protein
MVACLQAKQRQVPILTTEHSAAANASANKARPPQDATPDRPNSSPGRRTLRCLRTVAAPQPRRARERPVLVLLRPKHLQQMGTQAAGGVLDCFLANIRCRQQARSPHAHVCTELKICPRGLRCQCCLPTSIRSRNQPAPEPSLTLGSCCTCTCGGSASKQSRVGQGRDKHRHFKEA